MKNKKKKKDTTLASIFSPALFGDQYFQAFDDYVTINEAGNAVNGAIMFIVQLVKADQAGKIQLTENEKNTLYSSYQYLIELVDAYDD